MDFLFRSYISNSRTQKYSTASNSIDSQITTCRTWPRDPGSWGCLGHTQRPRQSQESSEVEICQIRNRNLNENGTCSAFALKFAVIIKLWLCYFLNCFCARLEFNFALFTFAFALANVDDETVIFWQFFLHNLTIIIPVVAQWPCPFLENEHWIGGSQLGRHQWTSCTKPATQNVVW